MLLILIPQNLRKLLVGSDPTSKAAPKFPRVENWKTQRLRKMRNLQLKMTA